MTSNNINIKIIANYLESIDKNLYQAFYDLDVFSLINFNKGLTFLYPASNKIRKNIIKLAYSNSPERSIDIIKSLFLLDHLPKISSFKKNIIPNALLKKLLIKEITKDKVLLGDDSEIEVDEKFCETKRIEKVNVYRLLGDCEPAYGDDINLKNLKNNTDSKSELKKIAKILEKQYVKGNKYVYYIVMTYLYKQSLELNFDKYVYQNLCAIELASFYNIFKPYRKNTNDTNFAIPLEVISEVLKICTDINSYNIGNITSKWKLYRDAIITKNRSSNFKEAWNKKYKEQMKILNVSGTAIQYVQNTKKYYNDDDKLATDLLTIYCYISQIQDSYDKDNFVNGFIFTMEHCFNDIKNIIQNYNDTANNITLYGNLLKSDVYKYIPTLSSENLQESKETNYVIIDGLPDPMEIKSLFSIEKTHDPENPSDDIF
jgi:hypothetical protein